MRNLKLGNRDLKDRTGGATARVAWWERLRGWLLNPSKHRLRREQLLALQPERVFAFLTDAGNLERTAPPNLHPRLLTVLTGTLEAGQILEYEWRCWGRALRMQTRLEQVTFPSELVEVQLQGPFLRWSHKRRLRIASGGTWVIDDLEYELSGGVWGRVAHRLWILGKLQRWFDYRQARTIELLLPDVAQAAHAPTTRASRARLRRSTKSSEETER